MNPISTLWEVKNIFPGIVANEFVNSMPRHALTEDAHLDRSGVDLHTRNTEQIHYPVEGFNLKDAQKPDRAQSR